MKVARKEYENAKKKHKNAKYPSLAKGQAQPAL